MHPKRLIQSSSLLLLGTFLLFLTVAQGTAWAQYHDSLTSGNVLDPDRLSQVDSVLQHYVDEGRVAGVVGLVMQDGEIVYEHAAGWADRESNRRMGTDAIFRIASQTKAITSAAILMLVEEGKINLNDPISRWMPTFENSTVAVQTDTGRAIVPANRPITIEHLLTHTSGISYGGSSLVADLYKEKGLGYGDTYGWYTADDEEPICETMDRLGTLPFVAQPGSDWVYGYNTDILGCVVERVSGLPLDQFFLQRITGPLGMEDTHFFLPPEKEERLATVYTPTEGSNRVLRAPDGPRGQGDYVEGPRRSFAGGAGLLSTARDYARFLEMIRRGGALDGKRYLSPHTIALMTSNQVGDLFSDEGMGFGLGFETSDRLGANGFTSAGTFGWSGAYGTDYEVDPKEDLVTVLMIQVVPYYGSGIREAFESAVYQALVPAE
ncbi:serine hydrolase domain-containing protein [Halalkalibaculum sp. DA3122]|uniref:serine hydrolase domain-containing protein n=1 Tax=Halalkalibaculum sp. DA3122 TaxID=3373607 RepID=UPI00375524AB